MLIQDLSVLSKKQSLIWTFNGLNKLKYIPLAP